MSRHDPLRPPVIRDLYYGRFVGGCMDGDPVPEVQRGRQVIEVASLPSWRDTDTVTPTSTIHVNREYYIRQKLAFGDDVKQDHVNFWASAKLLSAEANYKLWRILLRGAGIV